MSNAAKTFLNTITGSVTLTERDLWPLNDGPENPTKTDVADALRKYGRKASDAIVAWSLPCEVSVDGSVVMVEG